MRTIQITDKYYIRISTRNYIASELSTTIDKETGKSKELLIKPSYHGSFEQALENIIKRVEKESLVESSAQNLKEALAVIQSVHERFLTDSKQEIIKDFMKDHEKAEAKEKIEEAPVIEEEDDADEV